MNRNIFLLKSLLAGCIMLLLGGCYDDTFRYYEGDLTEGETLVSFNVNFEPFASTDLTRAVSGGTNGDIMKNLEDLCLLIYDEGGDLVDGYPQNIPVSNVSYENRTDKDAAYASQGELPEYETQKIAEDKTASMKFDAVIPVGKYYIIAVANLGYKDYDTSKTYSTFEALTDPSSIYYGEYSTLHELRSMRMKWDYHEIGKNNQMLGIFNLTDELKTPRADSSFTPVAINKNGISLKAWLRRCASKITVDFDGSALRENIYVYIKDVQIKHIASDCTLGYGKDDCNYNNAAGVRKADGSDNNSNGSENSSNSANTDNKDNFASLASLLDESYNKQAITFGEGADYKNWPYITTGRPYIMNDDNKTRMDLHSLESPSLFFYENMQGESTYPKIPTADPSNNGRPVGSGNAAYDYDGLPYGTYVEVTAHYISTNYDNVGDGEIKYRFMIGKDVKKNCDAERNSHFKLTLKLRGNANEYDWHIDYSDLPGFDVPNPWYVSYVYNHSSNMPFKYTPPEGEELVKIEAEIIKNPWYPTPKNYGTDHEEADYPGGDDPTAYQPGAGNRGNGNGFLSLWSPMSEIGTDGTGHRDGTIVLDTEVGWPGYVAGGVNINDKFFYGKQGSKIDKSKRSFYVQTTDDKNSGNEAYTFMKHHDSDLKVDKYTFSVPLFTREKILVKQTGFTGNNPFVAKTRTAQLKLTAYTRPIGSNDENGTARESKVIDVIQVKRLVNPKGVYRKAGNNEDFHVVLSERTDITDPTFVATISNGPWRAEIIGDDNFITLNGRQTITGNTGSEINFWIRFNKTNNKNTPNKNAIVRVLYNNYTCTHLIYVRQGYAPQAISPTALGSLNSPKVATSQTPAVWSTFNMIAKNLEAEDPRDEGSMFKFGNIDDPIDAVNNVYGDTNGDGDGKVLLMTQSEFVEQGPFRITKPDGTISDDYTKPWNGENGITYSSNGFGKVHDQNEVASIHDFEQLFLTPNVQYGYGVLYADGASETQLESDKVFGYYRRAEAKDAKERGMRGVFAYYYDGDNAPYSGRNLFFPIGRSAYGHRKNAKEKDNSNRNGMGILRYCSIRSAPAIEEYVFIKPAPLFTSLYRREGAIYWAKEKVGYPNYLTWNGQPDSDGIKYPESTIAYGLDLNYFTLDVNTITQSNVDSGRDACFVRCVQK